MNILSKALQKTIEKSGDFKKENELENLKNELWKQIKSGKITKDEAFQIYKTKRGY